MPLPKWACQQTGFGPSLFSFHLVISFIHTHTYHGTSMTTFVPLLTFLPSPLFHSFLSSAASSVALLLTQQRKKNNQDIRQTTRGTPMCGCLCVIISHHFSGSLERIPWRLRSLLWRTGIGHIWSWHGGLAQVPLSLPGGLLQALVVQNILTQTKSIKLW